MGHSFALCISPITIITQSSQFLYLFLWFIISSLLIHHPVQTLHSCLNYNGLLHVSRHSHLINHYPNSVRWFRRVRLPKEISSAVPQLKASSDWNPHSVFYYSPTRTFNSKYTIIFTPDLHLCFCFYFLICNVFSFTQNMDRFLPSPEFSLKLKSTLILIFSNLKLLVITMFSVTYCLYEMLKFWFCLPMHRTAEAVAYFSPISPFLHGAQHSAKHKVDAQ